MYPVAAEILRLLGGPDKVTAAIGGGSFVPGPTGLEILIRGGPMIRDIPKPAPAQNAPVTPTPEPRGKGAKPDSLSGRAWDRPTPSPASEQRHKTQRETTRDGRLQRARIERVVITRNHSDGYSMESFGSMSATRNMVAYVSHLVPEQVKTAFTNATGVSL